MNVLRCLTLGSTLTLLAAAGSPALADDHQEAAAKGRSNPAVTAEEESTVMPTNPNAGAGGLRTDGDPYQPKPENGDIEDDDATDAGY